MCKWGHIMEQDSTSELMNVLKKSRKRDIENLKEKFIADRLSFVSYMDMIISNKNIKRQDIFQKADIPQKYGYKILSGESHTTDRDKLLRIFIAIGMNLKEVQRAIELYKMPPLYPKRQRDAIIIIAINKGISCVDTVNDWLSEYGEEELSRSKE